MLIWNILMDLCVNNQSFLEARTALGILYFGDRGMRSSGWIILLFQVESLRYIWGRDHQRWCLHPVRFCPSHRFHTALCRAAYCQPKTIVRGELEDKLSVSFIPKSRTKNCHFDSYTFVKNVCVDQHLISTENTAVVEDGVR